MVFKLDCQRRGEISWLASRDSFECCFLLKNIVSKGFSRAFGGLRPCCILRLSKQVAHAEGREAPVRLPSSPHRPQIAFEKPSYREKPQGLGVWCSSSNPILANLELIHWHFWFLASWRAWAKQPADQTQTCPGLDIPSSGLILVGMSQETSLAEICIGTLTDPKMCLVLGVWDPRQAIHLARSCGGLSLQHGRRAMTVLRSSSEVAGWPATCTNSPTRVNYCPDIVQNGTKIFKWLNGLYSQGLLMNNYIQALE